jgi:hypothetical protein
MNMTWQVPRLTGSWLFRRPVLSCVAVVGLILGVCLVGAGFDVHPAWAFSPGEGTGSGWCSAYDGTALGSYDNVYACYGPNAPATPFNPGYGGFQCTELANRYLYNVNGDTVFGDNLVGGNFVATVSSQYGISTGSSGGSAMPVAGDIISMWGGSSGQSQSGDDTHVSVVTSVSGGTITTLNENDTSDSNGDNGINTITVSGSSWSFNGGFYTSFEWLNLASSTSPPPNGSYVSYDGNGYAIAGGAPLYVSNWASVGNPTVTPINTGQWDSLNPVPSNGTFIRTAGNGSIFEVAGGAPMYVSSCASFTAGCVSPVNVDPWDLANEGSPPSHLKALVANGTFITTVGNGDFFTVAGGAAMYVASCSNFSSGCGSPVQVDPWDLANEGAQFSGLQPLVANGTFITTVGNGDIFTVAGGAAMYVASCQDLPSGCGSTVQVDPWDIGNAGTQFSGLDPAPANGTFLNAYTNGQDVGTYVVAGGSALPVSDCSVLDGCPGEVAIDDHDIVAAGTTSSVLTASPTDGTVVQGLPSGDYREFIGGTVQAVAATSSAVSVNDSSVSSFPVGPKMTSVTPSSRGQGSTTTMTLTGTGFEQGATVTVSGKGVLLSSVVVNSYTSITASVTVKASAKAGTRTITVTNPDGASIACTNCLTIDAGPTLSTASPSSVAPGAKKVSVTLTGKGFQAGATVTVSGTGIKIVSVTAVSSTDIRLVITVPSGMTAGTRTVTITNPDGGTTQAQVLRIT